MHIRLIAFDVARERQSVMRFGQCDPDRSLVNLSFKTEQMPCRQYARRLSYLPLSRTHQQLPQAAAINLLWVPRMFKMKQLEILYVTGLWNYIVQKCLHGIAMPKNPCYCIRNVAINNKYHTHWISPRSSGLASISSNHSRCHSIRIFVETW